MKSKIFSLLLPALLALFQLNAKAEDIDLFTGAGSGVTVQAPNLLFIMDNAGAFSASASESCVIGTTTTALSGTVGGVEQCALYKVIDSLTVAATATVNIGIMMYNDNGVVPFDGVKCAGHPDGSISGNPGGCLMYPLTPFNLSSKPALLAWIKSWKTSGTGAGQVKANAQQTAATMQEAWAYFYAKTGISGRNYTAAAPNINCKNFVVFIGNGVGNNGTPGDSSASGNGPKQSLEGLNASNSGANATPTATVKQKELLTLSNANIPAATTCGTLNFPADNTHDAKGFYADEWARYMRANRISTYTVGFINPSDCKPDYPWLLASMAAQGGGKYFETTNYESLRKALENIFSEVRSVNSVFAAVSLPVSVNSQGTYLNQVFIGMFRPDPDALPRWMGNLKQYKMGFDNLGQFNMLDADTPTKTAISSSGSEFIGECAVSYWTPPKVSGGGDNYWTQMTEPNCSGYAASANSPDGNLVEKGGQAYTLRKANPATRIVTTCSPTVTSCNSATATVAFNTSTSFLTTTSLSIGTATSPTVSQLVNWARGHNNKAPLEVAKLNDVTLTTADMRPSVHGDVVHSRPAAVNFGTDEAPKVVVFYGGNDGMLRAINGNRTATFQVNAVDVAAGNEFWSFVPPEYFGKLLRRYKNEDGITLANRKDYAMDGPITAIRQGNDAYIYVGMRRGGRALYAFHVDGSTLNITLKWKRGCGDSGTSNCSDPGLGDFTNIAQTWSTPTVFTAKGFGGGAATSPLLIVGGGYDATCEDQASYSSCASPQGNRLYLLNALTGALIKTFDTDRGVIADVTVVNDAAGQASIIYTADLGGNIYRIQGASNTALIDTEPPANWTIHKVASLGCSTITTCTSPPNRKFMFAPDVVVDGNDYILLVGSGDREKPTSLVNPTQNYFFMVRDRPTTANWLDDTTNCVSSGTLCLNSLLPIVLDSNKVPVTPSDTDLASKKGWYLQLAANPTSGYYPEQVVTGAIAVFGVVYFTTHEPKGTPPGACVPNLGTSRAYAVKYKNAGAGRSSGDLFLTREDAGLSPDLVVGKVTLDNKQTVPFCIGCEGPIKPSQPIPPAIITNPAKIRSYWYIQK